MLVELTPCSLGSKSQRVCLPEISSSLSWLLFVCSRVGFRSHDVDMIGGWGHPIFEGWGWHRCHTTLSAPCWPVVKDKKIFLFRKIKKILPVLLFLFKMVIELSQLLSYNVKRLSYSLNSAYSAFQSWQYRRYSLFAVLVFAVLLIRGLLFAFKIWYLRIFPLIIRGFGYQNGPNQKTLLMIDGIIGPTCAI